MNGEKKFSLILLMVSILFLVGSLQIVPFSELAITGPGGYPILISVLCVLCAIWNCLEKKVFVEEEKGVFDKTIVTFFFLLIAYFVAILFIHYTLATLLFIFAAIFFLDKEGWRHAILISYIGTFMILLVFKYIFSVIMP